MSEHEVQDREAMRGRLMSAAQTLLVRQARDGKRFSLKALYAETGIGPTAFSGCFASKEALLAALLESRPGVPSPSPAAVPPAMDAWQERRLRVFERALNALEVKVDTLAREEARAIAQLEEKLATLSVPPGPAMTIAVAPQLEGELKSVTPPEQIPAEALSPALAPDLEAELKSSMPPRAESVEFPVLALERPAAEPISQEEMANFLQNAREAAHNAALKLPQPSRNPLPMRLAALCGGLTLVVLLVGAGLAFEGVPAHATQNQASNSGIANHSPAATGLARVIALAENGDAHAQTVLAFAYRVGKDVPALAAASLRWSRLAAAQGDPEAQFLLGTLYWDGYGVPANKGQAVCWFAAAAAGGNLKAMHNLAIAYDEGIGTANSPALAAYWFTQAAERGYTNSEFDLAVLYERGDGVPQSLRDALKWYGVAQLSGDWQAAERIEFLRNQLPAREKARVASAVAGFVPLPVLSVANTVPKL